MQRALSQGLHGNEIEVYEQKEISALKSIAPSRFPRSNEKTNLI